MEDKIRSCFVSINNKSNDDSSKLWLSKVEYDYNKNNLPKDILEKFLEILNNGVSVSGGEPIDFICNIISSNPSVFTLKGHRSPNKVNKYIRVINSLSFSLWNIDYSILGLEWNDNTHLNIWEWLGDIVTPNHFIGTMETDIPLFWCSTVDTFNELEMRIADKDDLATEIRDVLGLSHYGKDSLLLTLEIPEKLLLNKKLCAPTTLDALTNMIFMPSDDSNGFGWTLNLRTRQRGAKEVVVEKLSFTSDYTVKKIGKVKNEPPFINETILLEILNNNS